MSSAILPTIGCLLLFCAGSLADTGLKWDSVSIEKSAVPSDLQTEGVFAFTNTSSGIVEIRKVSTSCSCTTTKLEKKIYAPGETGEMRVIFTFGGRKGIQEKTILAKTSAEGVPDLLVLRVKIPDSVTVSQDVLTWQKGGATEAKAFEVTVADPVKTTVKAARALGTNFAAVLEEVESGRRFAVKVRPAATDQAMKGSVRLEIADPGNRVMYLRLEIKE